jgi:hypothetical protein
MDVHHCKLSRSYMLCRKQLLSFSLLVARSHTSSFFFSQLLPWKTPNFDGLVRWRRTIDYVLRKPRQLCVMRVVVLNTSMQYLDRPNARLPALAQIQEFVWIFEVPIHLSSRFHWLGDTLHDMRLGPMVNNLRSRKRPFARSVWFHYKICHGTPPCMIAHTSFPAHMSFTYQESPS